MLLRRGATHGMIETYELQYSHEEGLSALVDDLCLYLGWNIEIGEDDEDGEQQQVDRLIASADRFHKAQASRGGGKIAGMRTALDARREVLTHLSALATSLLRDAGRSVRLLQQH